MKYESWVELIEPYADGPLDELPEGLSELEKDFSASGFPWDDLTPDQRRSLAQHHDWQHDPALKNEQNAGHHIGYFERNHVQAWLTMGAVSPQNAALLFFGENPSNYKNNLPEMGEDFDLMKWSFEDAARDGRDRNLSEWTTVARARNLRGISIDGWEACITQAQAAPVVTPSASGAVVRHTTKTKGRDTLVSQHM